MDVNTPSRVTAGGNRLLGCWLIVAPFVVGAPVVGRWNDVLVGTAITAVVGYDYVGDDERPASAAGAGFVAILGCWLVVAPFALGLEGPALWNDVVSGTVVTAFGSYDAYVAAAAERDRSVRVTGE